MKSLGIGCFSGNLVSVGIFRRNSYESGLKDLAKEDPEGNELAKEAGKAEGRGGDELATEEDGAKVNEGHGGGLKEGEGDGEESGETAEAEGRGPEGDEGVLQLAKGDGAEEGPLEGAEEVVEETLEAVEEGEGQAGMGHGDVEGQPGVGVPNEASVGVDGGGFGVVGGREGFRLARGGGNWVGWGGGRGAKHLGLGRVVRVGLRGEVGDKLHGELVKNGSSSFSPRLLRRWDESGEIRSARIERTREMT